jgi:two-component system response regulator PilR (NtrC family)
MSRGSTNTAASLVSRPYRGNVRELENLVERAVTLALGSRVEVADLDYQPSAELPGIAPVVIPDEGLDLDEYLARIERDVLLRALERTGGIRKDAAKLLGMSFRSLRYRLSKYGLGDAESEGDEEAQEGERLR